MTCTRTSLQLEQASTLHRPLPLLLLCLTAWVQQLQGRSLCSLLLACKGSTSRLHSSSTMHPQPGQTPHHMTTSSPTGCTQQQMPGVSLQLPWCLHSQLPQQLQMQRKQCIGNLQPCNAQCGSVLFAAHVAQLAFLLTLQKHHAFSATESFAAKQQAQQALPSTLRS